MSDKRKEWTWLVLVVTAYLIPATLLFLWKPTFAMLCGLMGGAIGGIGSAVRTRTVANNKNPPPVVSFRRLGLIVVVLLLLFVVAFVAIMFSSIAASR